MLVSQNNASREEVEILHGGFVFVDRGAGNLYNKMK